MGRCVSPSLGNGTDAGNNMSVVGFLHQLQTLHDAEAMLLIDHDQAEVFKLHAIFE